jgi:hypothetical protein
MVPIGNHQLITVFHGHKGGDETGGDERGNTFQHIVLLSMTA